MKEIIYNSDNLLLEEMNEIINRVKILLINSNNGILLGYSHGIYQFIGGHVEENESFVDCIIRETEEETGIELKTSNIEPFMTIKHFNKNYPKEGINRISGIYYFVVYTDETINYNRVKYTDSEREGKFELRYVSLDNIENILEENIINNEKNKVIVPEMLNALEEYKKNKR